MKQLSALENFFKNKIVCKLDVNMHVPNFNNIEKTLFRLRNLFLTVTEKIA